MVASSLLLFGPVAPRLSQAYLSELRASIISNSNLDFVRDAVEDLPSLWPALQLACPQFSKIPGAEQLDQLSAFLKSGTFPNIKALNNLILAPLTVISQVVEFLRLGREAENAAFQIPRNVEGFCIGLLTAAAVACSQGETGFRQFAAIAIRLAVCVGSIVDLGEELLQDPLDRSSSFAIRWTTESGQANLENTLNDYSSAYILCITDKTSITVTIPSRDASSFAHRLKEDGLLVQSIGLRGRYHHPSNTEALRYIKDLCNRDKRFQLPPAGELVLPLRSNSHAGLLTSGALHEIVLNSILTEQSQWLQTVKATISGMGGKNINVISVGLGSFVPGAVASELNAEPNTPELPSGVTTNSPEISNGLAQEQSLHNQSSFHPTPHTQSDPSTVEADVGGSAIAVIGMACRFPNANSLEQFWQLISSGANAVQQVPKDRFDSAELWRDPKGPFWGNFLDEPETFDHQFFNISGREAKSMDPQQRLLLQVAYEAMESSGYYGPQSDRQSDEIGCYIGVGSVDYDDNLASENATAFSALGTLRAFISGRVSHYFGWSGPSITYDTACSSSATAIHSACKALQTGECSMAVAGGVNVMTSPKLFQNLTAGGFLNPTGASKAFDADANGYCRGEGAGLVVLKSLPRAIADGDSVLGVIAGSAINQGSNCTPITVPVSQSQSSLYRHALSTSGIESTDVSYVEAHGTGTLVGDPIECESIRQTFGGAHRTQQLFLGSVKDNIGHAEAASGAAALIKILLMIQNRIIPKQANFVSLNPKIPPLEPDRMTIPTQTQPWNSQGRTAVVNNYGAAGSNATIVVHEHPSFNGGIVKPVVTSIRTYLQAFPFFVSARSPQSLHAYLVALKSYLARAEEIHAGDALANLAYNLATRQNRTFEHSRAFEARSLSALSDQLTAVAIESNGLTKSTGHPRPIVLCFGGQNGRIIGLSEDLFNNCRVLKSHLTTCDSICRALGLPSLFPGIFQTEPLEDTVSLHCMLFAFQYASAKSWLDCGLKVDILIGHSFGQITALCVADSVSLKDSIRFIATRARLIRDQWGPEAGVMLAVEGNHQEVGDLLDLARKQHPSCYVEISCHNGPRNFVVAGSRASIEAIEGVSLSKGSTTRLKLVRLQNTHAFHSQLVDNILPDLQEVAQSIQFREPSIQVETCSQGSNWPRITADRIVQHSRMPVYFAAAVERIACRLKSGIWLEAGSGSPIIAMARRILQTSSGAEHIFQPIDVGGSGAQMNLARATCKLWDARSKVQFWLFHRCQEDSYTWINLPPYQFEKTRHWIQYKASVGSSIEVVDVPKNQKPQLLRRLNGDNSQALFSVDSTHDLFELCVKGHAVLHSSLCPASMYFELAIRAARDLSDPVLSRNIPHIQELKISSPLSLSPAESVFLRLIKDTMRDETWSFSLFSRHQQDKTKFTTHASGTVALLAFDSAKAIGDFQSLKRLVGKPRCEQILSSPAANGLSGSMVYKIFGRVVDYASYYRGVKVVSAIGHEAVGLVRVPNDLPPRLKPGCCDPVAIDNFLQVAGIHVNCLWDCKDDEVFVCTAIRNLSFSEQFMNKSPDERSWTVYSNFEPNTKGSVVNDIYVLNNDSGELVLTLMGAQFTSLPTKSLYRTLSKLNNSREPEPLSISKEQTKLGSTRRETYHQLDGAEPSIGEDVPDTKESRSSMEEMQPDQDHLLKKVQEMLSEVLEIAIGDIQPGVALSDLGVDSLMTTEVTSEIKSRFGVAISNAEFQDLTDLQSLSLRIQSSAPKQRHNKTQGSNEIENSSGIQTPNSIPTPSWTETSQKVQRPNGIQTSSEHSFAAFKDKSGEGFATSALRCFGSAKMTYDSIADETGFMGFCRSVYPVQAELVVAYIVEAFTALGCPLASLISGQRLPEIHYSSKHRKVVGQYYKILEDENLITQTTRGVLRTNTNIPKTSAQILHTAIIEKFPRHASEHKLLHTTGQKLAGCLADRDDPVSLLFGNATARALMTDVYTHAPMFKTGTIFLARYLVNVFHQFDSDREIQVLELGAGTGGTTSYLVDSLVGCGQKFSYTFTDLSSSLVASAKKKFARYNFMKYTTLDIEQAPLSQHLGRYDVVISTNCIHATKNLTTSTTNIRNMLRPDGILCLVELTQNLFWFDLVFGLLDGWWLFNDGRKHVLANESLWKQNLHRAGFQWVDWTQGDSKESQILRVIVASPSKVLASVREVSPSGSVDRLETQETVAFREEGGTQLLADIYYPKEADDQSVTRPVALMIHGGGHVMLSRKDVRPKQTQILLEAGFLPVSIDYRLCPEINLPDGPMRDVCFALGWARCTLPVLHLKRSDIRPSGDRVVAIGWSTGGHLAMTLAWTAPAAGIAAPNAILGFYCPSDYEDPFWQRANIPRGAERTAADAHYDLWEGVRDSPITAYNPPTSSHALGGWMAPEDPRSRICLHMNWEGQALPILLNGMKRSERAKYNGGNPQYPHPAEEQVRAVSPLAQVRAGTYRTPTFMVHGTRDDLIPWQQAWRTYEALRERGVPAEVRIIEGGVHLFDLYKRFERENEAVRAVREGYEFLKRACWASIGGIK